MLIIDTIVDFKTARIAEGIKKFKYKRDIESLKKITLLFYEAIFSDLCEQMDLSNFSWQVVFVPKNFWEIILRGFNNNKMLAKYLCRQDHFKILKLQTKGLKKVKLTKRQVGLSRVQRMKNLENAFKVSRKENFLGGKILLIDDITTTGSTLKEVGQKILDCQPACLKIYAFGKNGLGKF